MTPMIPLLLAVALLLPGQTTQSQTGVITGQLVGTNGQPATGVRVAAMPVPREGDTGVPTLVGLTVTDSNGRYTLEMIEPGTYYVTSGRVDSPTYFPGVGSVATAKSVLVTSGAKVSGIDFKTFEPPSYFLRGSLVLVPGQRAAPNSRMMLIGNGSHEASVKPDGTFEFPRLLAGRYSLRLEPSTFAPAVPIVIEDKSITGFEFVVPPVVTVTGTMVVDDASASPNVSVWFSDTKQNTVMEVTSKQAFALTMPEGEYRVQARRIPNGYAVKAFTSGTTNLLTDTLKLSRTTPTTAVTITLGAVPTVPFAGRVVSSRGGTQRLRHILLGNGEVVESVTGTIQANGSFAFDRVAPGNYVAVMSVEEDAEPVKLSVVVPPGGNREAEIRIPELRKLSLVLGIEGNLEASVVTLRFTQASGAVTTVAVDGSAKDAPFGFSLREGEYRVTVSILQRQSQDRLAVKTLRAGEVDLLKAALVVGPETAPEIRVTLGK